MHNPHSISFDNFYVIGGSGSHRRDNKLASQLSVSTDANFTGSPSPFDPGTPTSVDRRTHLLRLTHLLVTLAERSLAQGDCPGASLAEGDCLSVRNTRTRLSILSSPCPKNAFYYEFGKLGWIEATNRFLKTDSQQTTAT
jgi:hypothetical protein